MARILNIDSQTGACTIGMDNGGVRIVDVKEVDYQYPMVGDYVNVIERPDDVLITKMGVQDGTIPTGNQTYAPSQQVNGKFVDKVAYVLFAFFLGSFGVHKFYAGKTGLGVLYLCFFWTGIPAIVGFVEGILGALKPADAYGNILIT